ncbi:MAG: PQQ-binding-like beta-propeller repeat protein, partial [Bacteroidia bacterium]|nr:PQQ-binding-like beta-propeller repeat protein [Bacteroidia bacterium]
MKLAEKDITIIKGISQAAGGFTIIVALLMIFGLIQLKTINPLDNPALVSVKEQYDRNPENVNLAEQVRAMDLMARKAYFASRRQVETGSYLLVAGAIIFIFCQRLITGNEKTLPDISGIKPDQGLYQAKYRKYLLGSALVLTAGAIGASFMLRNNLPDLNKQAKTVNEKTVKAGELKQIQKTSVTDNFTPDKTNFPFFRGQDGRGIAGGSDYPVEWNGENGTNIKWKTAINYDGKSSPVIWSDKLFITGAEGLNCYVQCFDKNSGNILWSTTASGIPGEPSVLPKMDPGAGLAVSSVAVNSKAVCAVFANGNLISLDHKSKKKWAINLGVPNNSYGYSSSLIIYKDILIVQYDSDKKLSIMGFDIETGTLLWETLRQGHPVWSSPVIANFGKTSQIIVNGNPSVSSYDPVTGAQLWSIDCMSGDVAPSVAVNSFMAFAVTDYTDLVAIEPGNTPVIKWKDNTYTPDISSPVATDNYLFLVTGYGDAVCYNAEKGDTLWTHYFGDQFYSSPMIANDMVYFLNRSGKMHIVKAADKFEIVAESSLGESSECTPAFSDNNIYI